MAELPDEAIRQRSSEAGDTLIELLIAIVIIALATVALLAALTTSITSSTEHRQLSVNDTLLKSFANVAVYSIELNTSSPLFTNCATTTMYGNAAIGWTDPAQYANYHTQITQVVYWDPTLNGGAGGFNPGITQAVCAVTPADKNGIQELMITATAPNGFTLSMSAIVRDPNFE